VSVRVMSWVWDQQLPTTKKMLLLAIADHADDEGNNAWPSKARLSQKVGVEPNRIRQLLRELEIDGWLVTNKQRGGTLNTPSDRRPNLYSINTQRGLPQDSPRGLVQEPSRGLVQEPLIIQGTSGTSFAGKKKKRRPDTIFDAIVSVCLIDPASLTASARGSVNKAVKELRDVEATAETITRVAAAYRKKWPDLSLSPAALAKHYPSLVGEKSVRMKDTTPRGEVCDTCGGTGWQERESPGVARGEVFRCGFCDGTGFALPGGAN